jgi:hypothetical protein
MKNDSDSSHKMRRTIATLLSDSSLPLHEVTNIRANQKRNTISTFGQHQLIRVKLVSLTRDEWENAFSHTDKKTKFDKATFLQKQRN